MSMPIGLTLLALECVADLAALVTGREPPFGIAKARRMSPTTQGLLVLAATLIMLLSGAPVAFGLGVISIVFIVMFQGFDALRVVAETFYSGLNDFTLVSIPMFVMMGAAIGSSPAGKDLYIALDRWLYRPAGRARDLEPRRVRGIRGAHRLLARVLRGHRQDGHSEMRSRGTRTTWPRDRSAPAERSASSSPLPSRSSCTGSRRRLPSAGFSSPGDARAAPHRAFHAVDALHHLEARLPLARAGLPLHVAREIRVHT
jgi:hypothetical protein